LALSEGGNNNMKPSSEKKGVESTSLHTHRRERKEREDLVSSMPMCFKVRKGTLKRTHSKFSLD